MKRKYKEEPEYDSEDLRECTISARCRWSTEEDAKLVELAAKYREKSWSRIAEDISELGDPGNKGKTAKQCRERWHNHLNPKIMREKW